MGQKLSSKLLFTSILQIYISQGSVGDAVKKW